VIAMMKRYMQGYSGQAKIAGFNDCSDART
jgi:hypothetical protein